MFVRIALIVCHVFMQALWIVTSPGKNYESFIKTWINLRSVPIVIFEMFAFAQVILLPYLAFPMDLSSAPVQILGFGISVAGLALACWAKLVMGTNWGRPAQHDKRSQSALVTSGPFAFSRNPIYVGLFLLFAGQQIALLSYGVLLAIPFAMAIKKSVAIEEDLLMKYFGKTYRTYTQHVPRFL